MVSFHCFRDGKCEWTKGLQDFTFQFNEISGKNYTLSKCLDVSDRTKKQPEVLLKSGDDQPIVIECKKIVYPPNYYEAHAHFHKFGCDFNAIYEEKLKHQIPTEQYEICINKSDLYKFKGSELHNVAKQIVNYILNHLETFNSSKEILSEVPIFWYFRQVPEIKRNNAYKSGLTVSRLIRSGLSTFNTVKAEEEITRKLADHLLVAKEKFQEYKDCLKILILEICGDSYYIPGVDKIVEIVKNANTISGIDQIWLAYPQDELENLVIYHQIL